MDDNEVTASKAAEILGVTPTHVRWYYRRGLLAARKVGDRLLVFNRADLEAFVKPKQTGRPRKAPPEPKPATATKPSKAKAPPPKKAGDKKGRTK